MNSLTLLAQASDSSNWLAPIILAVVVLLVVLLAWASRARERRSEEPTRQSPSAAAPPEVRRPTTDLERLREGGFDAAEIEAILAKPAEKRTVAEVKKLNLATKADPALADRKTAIERTEQDRAEHAAAIEPEPEPEPPAELEPPAEPEPEERAIESQSEIAQDMRDFAAVAEGLEKTRDGFSKKFFGLFRGKEAIDDALREQLEEFLYSSDIGAKAASRIMEAIDTKLRDDVKRDPEMVWEFVREYMTREMLMKRQGRLDFDDHKPFVLLVLGVNGAGKTTTIGKLASRLVRQKKKVLIVAGDTFRAAAVEQLGVWAERVGAPLHVGKEGADPASVVFDGVERGLKEGFDVVLCDTSGRLHTDIKLMDELRKIARVAGKAMPGAPHEVMLVLDANQGQNAVAQARTFGEALKVSGLALTKLDGTARGGVILGIGEELEVPVRYIGIGEGIKDLRPFDAGEFAEALFL